MTLGKWTALRNEVKTWVLTAIATVFGAKHLILMWCACGFALIALFDLLTNNNAWLGMGWAFAAAVAFIARWLSLHDEQISKLVACLPAEKLFRDAVVAREAQLERDIALLRSQLDIHIRSTTAGVRPRPTPYKRTP